MADNILYDTLKGCRDSWGAVAALTNLIPLSRVYFDRVPERVEFPYVVIGSGDVSQFFGGMEYFSGSYYIKRTKPEFNIFAKTDYDFSPVVQAIASNLTWSSTDVKKNWTVPNATVLYAKPDVEKAELVEEQIDGLDILKYTYIIELMLQPSRG